MTKKPAKQSGSPKPPNMKAVTEKLIGAAAQMPPKPIAGSAAQTKSKRAKAASEPTAHKPKRYRRNIRDSIYLYLETVKFEERLKTLRAVEQSKTLH